MNKDLLAKQAVYKASRLRMSNNINPFQGLCPFDLGRKLGISMRFVSIPNLEGMYSIRPSPSIIIGNERPLGRRRYTCGHELGHHVFGHGCKIDEFNFSLSNPEEYIAQRFSAALLMPKLAIDSIFSKRGWNIKTGSPEQFFLVAQELGVGYETLITNLEVNTKQLSKQQADNLRKVRLPSLRNLIAGFEVDFDVFHLSNSCARPKLDIEIGDILIVAEGTKIEAPCVQKLMRPKMYFKGIAPGSTVIQFISGKSCELRVNRRKFCGLAHYMYLEEVDDE